jgi:hypothetical protein
VSGVAKHSGAATTAIRGNGRRSTCPSLVTSELCNSRLMMGFASDWEAAHYAFTYCNALHQLLKRITAEHPAELEP